MKIIFLDIDGVLNSVAYDRSRTADDGNIDESRLVLLRELVEQTGARLVLTSSWRSHWDPLGEKTDAVGKELEAVFTRKGLQLFYRTSLTVKERAAGILAWLAQHDVAAYVIIDDLKLGWGALEAHVVKTDPRIGRGLGSAHVREAIRILNQAD